nr:hypothetical protein [Candidatus Sigynarchaeota archaeon]
MYYGITVNYEKQGRNITDITDFLDVITMSGNADLKEKLAGLQGAIDDATRTSEGMDENIIREAIDKLRNLEKTLRNSTSKKPTIISLRLSDEAEKQGLKRLASESGMNVSDYIRARAFQKGQGQAEVAPVQHEIIALLEDINFFFAFFTKNAKNLDITEEERKKVKEIFNRKKNMEGRMNVTK